MKLFKKIKSIYQDPYAAPLSKAVKYALKGLEWTGDLLNGNSLLSFSIYTGAMGALCGAAGALKILGLGMESFMHIHGVLDGMIKVPLLLGGGGVAGGIVGLATPPLAVGFGATVCTTVVGAPIGIVVGCVDAVRHHRKMQALPDFVENPRPALAEDDGSFAAKALPAIADAYMVARKQAVINGVDVFGERSVVKRLVKAQNDYFFGVTDAFNFASGLPDKQVRKVAKKLQELKSDINSVRKIKNGHEVSDLPFVRKVFKSAGQPDEREVLVAGRAEGIPLEEYIFVTQKSGEVLDMPKPSSRS
jgi:hypothetical protein